MMPTERDHHTSKYQEYQFVVIPQGKTGSTRSFKASVTTLVLVVCFFIATIVGLTVTAIVYTPAGLLIPISEEQLRERYGAKLFDVQLRLNKVSSEVLILREYNNKLRKALGQQEMPADSTFDFSVSSDVAFNTQNVTAEKSTEPDMVQQQPVKYNLVAEETDVRTYHTSFPITAPAMGYISRKLEKDRGHLGIDYAGKIGSLIVSAADGFVIFTGYTIDDGYTIIISHGNGYLTIYKHNQSILKSVGESVRRGEPIALLGNSGRTSYGPHLHFELWKDGLAQNPNDYLIASEL